ncbi:MAG: NAD-dependent epimerase/dehydratase family protein [Acidimicrobiales bacterium]
MVGDAVILVTGGMGFIGLHVAGALAGAGEDVVITRFRKVRSADFVEPHLASGRVKVAAMDVTDPFSVLETMAANAVDGVIHLAVPALGVLGVGQEMGVNVVGLRNVLEAARALGVPRLTIASSVAVYAGAGPGPWHEQDPLPVTSPTPTTAFKKAEEILALHYGDRTGLDVVCVRIGAVYGPLYHSMSNLPSRLVHAAVRPQVPLAPRPSMSGARADLGDLLYVRDCAEGLVRVHRAPSRSHRVYNLGGGRAVPEEDVAAAVEKAVPGWQRPEVCRDAGAGVAAAGVSGRYMDLTRIAEVGFSPRYDIISGIADYAGWLRSHEK